MTYINRRNTMAHYSRVGLLLFAIVTTCQGVLYPRESESRDIRSLDGIWQFRACPSLEPDKGFSEQWYASRLRDTGATQDMPVPASYNDITTDSSLRTHTGWVWYDREFYLPPTWNTNTSKVFVRVGATNYDGIVWINGQEVMRHSGPHLPFETDISAYLNKTQTYNYVTIATNNTLNENTIPQGEWVWHQESENYPASSFDHVYTFDFFNYGGLSRPVVLYTVPKEAHIKGLTTSMAVSQALDSASVNYTIDVESANTYFCFAELLDHDGNVVSTGGECSGMLSVSSPRLWWPFSIDDDAGYMYDLKLTVYVSQDQFDIYRQPIGIREVAWNNNGVYINHAPFYFHGVNKHEDSNIRGKGLDLSVVTKDFNLMRWMGANSFRTSHYPYAEEILDFADRNGIVVISECSGVNLHTFNIELQQNHEECQAVMEELVIRDRNHPSVVMWSIANEPVSDQPAARDYFQAVADYTRALDPTRPLTLMLIADVTTDNAAYAVDVVSINRYFGWYYDTGRLDLCERQMAADIHAWSAKHGKPVIVSEYGADTVHGFHELPSIMFTEEFQDEFMNEYFKAFDSTRAEGLLIGELIWNFADFMTKEEVRRAWGNRKGVFTRDRHPKSSAHLLKKRYWALMEEMNAQKKSNLL